MNRVVATVLIIYYDATEKKKSKNSMYVEGFNPEPLNLT
jgi:hypothetical protein